MEDLSHDQKTVGRKTVTTILDRVDFETLIEEIRVS